MMQKVEDVKGIEYLLFWKAISAIPSDQCFKLSGGQGQIRMMDQFINSKTAQGVKMGIQRDIDQIGQGAEQSRNGLAEGAGHEQQVNVVGVMLENAEKPAQAAT